MNVYSLPALEDVPSISLSDEISSSEMCSAINNNNELQIKSILTFSNIPSWCSTSESLDDSVSEGHFVALIMDSNRLVDIPNNSFKQSSSISSIFFF